MDRVWTFAIDRGGTFTDIVAMLVATGVRGSRNCCPKIPANMPMPRWRASAASSQRKAERSAKSGWARPSPPMRCSSARASGLALAITRGFGDALRIGYQARPEIFARHIVLPSMLYETVVEIDERIGADGTVVRAARRGARPR